MAAGCNALTLDGLQAGSGGGSSVTGAGGQGDGASASSTAITGGSASSTTATSTSTASAVSASGGGGDGGAGGSGGSGGCPDVCASSTAALCESFDGVEPLDGWFTTQLDTVDPVFEVVQDPHVSCPNAVSITYLGVVEGEDGGWAQLNKAVAGAPAHVVLSSRVWRDTMSPDPEGVFEVAWRLGDLGCYLQVYLGEQPPEAIFYSDEYADTGDGVQMASGSVLLGGTTLSSWVDLEVDLALGPMASVSVTVDGVTATSLLDGADLAACDGGMDPGSLQVRIGPPYNQVPTRLVYDDVRVVVAD